MRKFFTLLAALSCLSLTNCGYNAIQTNDEQVKAGWSEDAAANDIVLADYAAMQRYKEWMPFNIRAAYRYLRGP